MSALLRKALAAADRLLVPFVWVAAMLLKAVRWIGIRRLPLARATLMRVGVYSLRDHYYDPQFDHRNPRRPYSAERSLPAIDWNVDGKLRWLGQFRHAAELDGLPMAPAEGAPFHFDNDAFMSGDAKMGYQLVRATKPKRIFEIGSGRSTRRASLATAGNRAEEPTNRVRQDEPYEMPWLGQSGVEDQVQFWNERHLEAFLADGRFWLIVGALNFLHGRHYDALMAVCTRLTPEREPGSFYLREVAG